MDVDKLFDYDADAPLDVAQQTSRQVGDLLVLDLTYASPRGGRVPASLVVPKVPGPHAGILMGHGTGPAGRRHMLPYALDLARTGAVALLIDAPYVRRQASPVTFTPQDAEGQRQHIVDLRRAVDLLAGRPDVHSDRLAYIGHSHGAAMGGLLAGVEDRIGAYVLASGDGGLVSHFGGEGPDSAELLRLPEEVQQRWLEAMGPIEPIRFVGRAAPAALLFQAGLHDEAVPVADAEAYYEAGSEPKEILWYDAGHVLDEQALLDQVQWLAERVSIGSDKFVFRHGCGHISCRAD